jgi:hypothetical protein
MRDAGCGMRDAGCGMRDARCGMRDAGCGMRDAGCRMQDAGCRMQDAGCMLHMHATDTPPPDRCHASRGTRSPPRSQIVWPTVSTGLALPLACVLHHGACYRKCAAEGDRDGDVYKREGSRLSRRTAVYSAPSCRYEYKTRTRT